VSGATTQTETLSLFVTKENEKLTVINFIWVAIISALSTFFGSICCTWGLKRLVVLLAMKKTQNVQQLCNIRAGVRYHLMQAL